MYGRRTGRWQLTPFDFRSAALFVPRFSPSDRIRTFAVCGGMPYYLERFEDNVPLAENILRHILYRDSFLHEEAELLLRQELNDPHNYFSTLRAIAAGRTRNSESWLDQAQLRPGQPDHDRAGAAEARRAAPTRHRRGTIQEDDLHDRRRLPGLLLPLRGPLPLAAAHSHRRRAAPTRHGVPQLDHFVSKPTFKDICRTHMQRAEQARRGGSLVGAGANRPGPAHQRVARRGGGRPRRHGPRRRQLQVDERPDRLGGGVPAHAPVGPCPGRRLRPPSYFFSRSGFDEPLRRLGAADPERYSWWGLRSV